ncbi:alpha/beta fold hydrolase [Caulobacter sp. 17J80-11]|uniref:alpha/beta fold hydrolase n=1 Tax=Caulobacter sp. 17J80-11 TaxID=2763502 RepID=UPI0016539D2C|nr:alpha/beta hydrolase [Caulobacter sp. 17J80-11]MBC6983554.1 alpha/beta hydrolase [Caulobacter sp. 17J80-11]
MTGFTDRWWTSADGLKLYARDYAAAPGPARLPVVCIHGLTRNSRDFGEVAPYLAASGRRVLAVDVRGRGRSDRDPEPMNYHPGTYAEDVGALFDQLGLSQAVFMGTSMGGLITMMLALRRPELIAGSVINDVGPQLSPVGLARIVAYTGKPVEIRNWRDAREYVKRTNGAAFPNNRDRDWRMFVDRVFDRGPRGRPVLAYDPRIAEPFKAASPDKPAPDMLPLFMALARKPMLLVRGGISDLLDQDGVALMRQHAPNMAYVEVPDVGHAPMLTEPAAKAAILRFLGELG